MAEHDFSPEHAEVFRSHTRAIAHMRLQISAQRLCLIFGAGAGHELGFPEWKTLLSKLGQGLEGFEEATRTAENEVILAQLLVKLFEYDFNKKHPIPPLDDARAQQSHLATLNAAWRDRIYDALYGEVIVDESKQDEFLKKDCYYKSFLEVIKRSYVTITYNFDDSIERFLSGARSAADKTKKRGYTTIHDDYSQLPALTPIIYHPNGFLAHQKAEKPSAQLVLSEESFSEQLTESIAGRHAVLHSELSQKTCLFIGCSLSDPNLSYFIRRNAQLHPGHFHYIIDWTGRNGEKGKCPQAYAERLFEIYNLITLSLSTKEIMILGDLLSYPNEFLLEAARENGIDPMFTYIVTGAVGCGKSTMVSHFRSLRQHEEWLEPRRAGMEKQVDKIPDERVREIDDWVDKQFALKNRVLYANENAIGVHILDRGPLDPLAFTKDGSVSRRAKRLKAAICKKSKLQREIVPAHVILLRADPTEMEIRATSRGKDFKADVLEKQEKDIIAAYGESAGVTVVDTRGLSISEVVKRVARIIHHEPYAELDLTARVDELQKREEQLPLDLD